MFVHDCGNAKNLCYKHMQRRPPGLKMDHCHINVTVRIYHSAIDTSGENGTIAARRASGRWGKGDGCSSQASAACRHSHLRQPSTKTSTSLPKTFSSALNFARNDPRSADLPDGLTAAGVAILSTRGNNKTAAIEIIHNTMGQPRETRSKCRGGVARDDRVRQPLNKRHAIYRLALSEGCFIGQNMENLYTYVE